MQTTTNCGFLIADFTENIDIYQDIMTEGFHQKRWFIEGNDGKKIVYVFENIRSSDDKDPDPEDVEVIVNWEFKDGVSGKVTKESCNNFSSDINILSGEQIFSKESVICSIYKQNVTNPDAIQITSSLPEGYLEIDRKVQKDTSKNLTTITITNQKTDFIKENFKVKVIWQVKEGDKDPVVQNCNNSEFKTSIWLAEDANIYATKVTNCGFEEKDIANPNAGQDNIITPDYHQVDRIDGVYIDGTKMVTFINQKETDPPNVEFEVRVIWQVKEGNSQPIIQDCNDFHTLVNILENGNYFADKLTSCGFKESGLISPSAIQFNILSEGFEQIDTTTHYEGNTKVITFINQSGELLTKDFEVKIKWLVEDEDGDQAEQDCNSFKSKVKVTDDGKLKDEQESGCGFEVKSVTSPDAIQTIISQDFTEINKQFNDDKTALTFTNLKDTIETKDVEIKVIWQTKEEDKDPVVQNCSEYKTEIVAVDGSNVVKQEVTGCGFDIKDVVNFDAS